MTESKNRQLFTRIAAHYDVINRLLSLGQDQRWRSQALAFAQLPAGGRLLDVATGTGDVLLLAAEKYPQAHVTGVDVTPAMLELARRKLPDGPALAASDGLALGFAEDAFDAVTSAFMMRNVPDVVQAFREQRRVVKPGGRVVCLEMTWPRRFPMNVLFTGYFFGLAPLLGWVIAGAWDAYLYLPRSVRAFPPPAETAALMEQAGLREVSWKPLMAGTVIIHVGVK